MNWITTKVREAGVIEQEITISAVDQMFAVVANLFSEGEHNGQKKWNTVIRALQKNLNFCIVCLQTFVALSGDSGWWWALTFAELKLQQKSKHSSIWSFPLTSNYFF